MDVTIFGVYEPPVPEPITANHARGFALALRHALSQVEPSHLDANPPAATRDLQDSGRAWIVTYAMDLVPGSTEVLRYRAKIQVADWPL